MNLSGNTFVAIAADGRLFGLDPQLLFDAAVTAVNVFVLFLLLTFILFNPVRNMLKKRQDKITSDRENAENDKKEASALKAEYEAKLKDAHKEAEQILSDARKTAMHNETKIIDEAKAEAARIIERSKNFRPHGNHAEPVGYHTRQVVILGGVSGAAQAFSTGGRGVRGENRKVSLRH